MQNVQPQDEALAQQYEVERVYVVGSPGIDHRHGGPVVDTADSR